MSSNYQIDRSNSLGYIKMQEELTPTNTFDSCIGQALDKRFH